MEFGIQSKISLILSDNASNAIKSIKDLNTLKDGEEESLEEETDSDGSDYSDSESECDEEPSDESEEDLELDEIANNKETDDAEFVNSFKEEKFRRGRCIVHTMQLPICRVCKKKRSSFGRVLRKTKKFVVKYRRSAKAKAILRKTSFKLRLKGWVKTRWWSEIEMASRVVMAAGSPGKPLETLSDRMDWSIEISDKDVDDLKSYLSIMTPFMDMGNKLGAEKLSTLHLVFPSISELLEQLDQHIEDGNNKSYCKNLRDKIKKYFRFLIDPESEDFEPLYITATFLSPVYKFVLDDELKEKAIDNLKKMLKKQGPPVEVEENDGVLDLDETNNNVEVSLPGFKLLSSKILNSTSNNIGPIDDGDSDIKQYESKSKIYLDRLKAGAYGRAGPGDNKKKLKVMDPLDFWIKEVIFCL